MITKDQEDNGRVRRRKKVGRHATITESVESAEAADAGTCGAWVAFASPLAEREFVDEDGVRWQLRRGTLKVPRLEQLLRDPYVRVLHQQGTDLREVPVEDRAAFLALIRPYLKGVRGPSAHDLTDFVIGEFKDDGHRSLLFIEEHC
ncbi:hypothetical protein [Actinopolymorpha alba]|uniref:hypothetical protein n=1 Tax=Actinopolymorpha alba TaxID=533267 RepID=UPI0012F631D4|nr:hypothetical protein [Actinopolymorpha alba]